MDEAALIADARRGDVDAFNRLALVPPTTTYNPASRLPGGGGEAPFFPPNEGPGPPAERAEVPRAIERCLHGLPDEFRTVVILADVLALDSAEVAGAMGSPIATVRG